MPLDISRINGAAGVDNVVLRHGPPAYLSCLATSAGPGRISRNADVARFFFGSIVKTVLKQRSLDWLTGMAASHTEIERRHNVALAAIRRVHGSIADTQGVTLFVSHHIDELADEFWLKHCGIACPEPSQVLDAVSYTHLTLPTKA